MSLCSKLLAAVVGLAAATDAASAADLPTPPRAPVPFTWNGLYLGLNAGYSGASITNSPSDGSGSGTSNIPGGIGGVQFGVNYQFGSVVAGFEADFDGSMATKSFAAGTASGNNQIPWIGTLRGRLGYAFDRYLLYVTAGGAASQLLSLVNVGALGSASTSNTIGGWTAGGGLEAAITDNLSARIEYLYLDTGTITVAQVGVAPPPPVVTVTGRLQDNLVRVGLNYRFPHAW
jgi:outer membrane immunogenic protein